jgi:hypothetical protein
MIWPWTIASWLAVVEHALGRVPRIEFDAQLLDEAEELARTTTLSLPEAIEMAWMRRRAG